MKPTKNSTGRCASACQTPIPTPIPARSSSSVMIEVETTVNTEAIRSFRVRYRTSTTPGTNSHSMAGVAAHQVAILSPVRPVTKAPRAAGLKTCLPRHASAYFDAEARTQANATPATSMAWNEGQNRK